MRLLVWLCALVNISSVLASEPAAKSWSWTIDGALYGFRYSQKEMLYTSESAVFRFSRQPCLERASARVINELERRVNEEPNTIEQIKDYPYIELRVPGDSKPRKVLRGTDLGLFLIGFRMEMERIQFVETQLCR